jgi:hypothetical protein
LKTSKTTQTSGSISKKASVLGILINSDSKQYLASIFRGSFDVE